MTRVLTLVALAACAVVAASASTETTTQKPDAKIGEIDSYDIIAKLNELRSKVPGLPAFTAASLGAPLRKIPSSRAEVAPATTFKCNAFAEEFKLNHIGSSTAPTSTSTEAPVAPPDAEVRAEAEAGDINFTLSFYEKEGTLTDDDVVTAFQNGILKFNGKAPPVVKDNLTVYADAEAMGFVNLYTTQTAPKVGCWKMTKCAKESVLCKFIPGTVKKTDATGPLSEDKFSEILSVYENSALSIAPSAAALVGLLFASFL